MTGAWLRIAARVACVPLLFALGACSTSKGARSGSGADAGAARGGGYYLDDGPGHLSPADVAAIPDAIPRAEPVLVSTSRPYAVFGRTYVPMSSLAPYRERGIASWYGRRYHGKPTSSGEPYDMYAMTAAHPTLPIPSYVRVTRPGTGRSVVVRINDRGPFLQNRVIDLSYTAAAKLGFVERGSAEVEVEAITRFDAPGPPLLVAGSTPGAGSTSGAQQGGAVAARSGAASGGVAVEGAGSGGAALAGVGPGGAGPGGAGSGGAGSGGTGPSVAGDPPIGLTISSSRVESSTASPMRDDAPGRLVVETRFSDGGRAAAQDSAAATTTSASASAAPASAAASAAPASAAASAAPTSAAASTAPTSAAVSAAPASASASAPAVSAPAASAPAAPGPTGFAPTELASGMTSAATLSTTPSSTTPSSSAPPATGHASGPGFWLQLGAFSSADSARAALERLRRELAWLGARFDLRHEGGLYKIQAGPWPQREHALDAAARVRGATALQPFPLFR